MVVGEFRKLTERKELGHKWHVRLSHSKLDSEGATTVQATTSHASKSYGTLSCVSTVFDLALDLYTIHYCSWTVCAAPTELYNDHCLIPIDT